MLNYIAWALWDLSPSPFVDMNSSRQERFLVCKTLDAVQSKVHMGNPGGKVVTAGLHYHIRWSGKVGLDWQQFRSREEAHAAAAHLVLPGESCTIEDCSEDCLGRLLRAQIEKVRSTTA